MPYSFLYGFCHYIHLYFLYLQSFAVKLDDIISEVSSGANMTENRCVKVLLVGTPIINFTINFLAKSWKEVMKCESMFMNHIKEELHRVIAKVLQRIWSSPV